jgi:hypothetical protein
MKLSEVSPGKVFQYSHNASNMTQEYIKLANGMSVNCKTWVQVLLSRDLEVDILEGSLQVFDAKTNEFTELT